MVAASTVVPEPTDNGPIWRTLTAVLDSLLASFQAYSVEPPAQQYVHVGELAIDFTGEHLAVALTQDRAGAPGAASQEDIGFNSRFALEVDVYCIRNVPGTDDNGPPEIAALQQSARALAKDWWVVHRCIVDNQLAALSGTGELVGAPYRAAALRQIDAYGPEGFAGGLVAQLSVELS